LGLWSKLNGFDSPLVPRTHRESPALACQYKPKAARQKQEGRKVANQQRSRNRAGPWKKWLTYDEDSIIFSDEGGNSCAARGIPDKVRI